MKAPICKLLSVAMGCITGLLAAAPAIAVNTTAANADFLYLGTVRSDSLSSGTTERWYKLRLEAGRSYAYATWAPFNDPSEEATVGLDLTMWLDDGTTSAPGQSSLATEPNPVVTSMSGDIDSIIPTTSGTFRMRVRDSLVTTSFTVHTMLLETTLFCPWYFVDSANGYDGYVEVKNNTNTSVSVVLTARNSSGASVGTSTFTVAANGTQLRTVGGDMGVANGFGGIQIAHRAMAGGVSANVTTLSPVTGLSFDSPCSPRMQWGTMSTF